MTTKHPILLVDDEEPVLEFEHEVLSGAGASIVALTRGDHAIPLLERQSFDVLVFDGKMPGRYNGVDICDWLAKHRPELLDRVILTVSNVEDAELRSRIQGLGVRSLSKPFQVGDLLRGKLLAFGRHLKIFICVTHGLNH